MTTAELIARYRQLIAYDLDSVLGPLPDPDDAAAVLAYDAGIVGYLNEATVDLARPANLYDPAVPLTLTAGKGRYPLDDPAFASRILAPYSVTVGGVRLRSAAGDDYALWTLNELVRAFPTWSTDPRGTPTKAVLVGNALLLHPVPSAGGVATVDAKVAPPRLSALAPGDSPDLPIEMHPGVALMAVYASCLPFAQTPAQLQRLTAFQSQAVAVAEQVGRDNANARLGNATTRAADLPQRMWM